MSKRGGRVTRVQTDSAIELRNVTKRFARGLCIRRALRGVSLRIARGEIVALIGAVGSGKTTLLRIMAGRLQPTSGEVAVLGRSPKDDLERRAGIVATVFGLPELRATRPFSLAMPAVIRLVGPGTARQSGGRKILEALGRDGATRSRIGKLSSGERRGVAIVRALATRPRLLLIDDPTRDLDDPWAADVFAELLHSRCAFATTIVFATRHVAVAAHADRVLSLRDGRVSDQIVAAFPDDPRLIGPRQCRRTTALAPR